MEPLYYTSTTINWKEYKKFYKTDNAYMRIVTGILLFSLVGTLFVFHSKLIPSLLIVLAILLTLGIYFLLPVFLLKREYHSLPIYHDLKVEYCFYPGFFTVSSKIGTEYYSYKQIQETIETTSNFYFTLPGDQHFILEKKNCSAELLKYLLTAYRTDFDEAQLAYILENTQPSLPKPLYESHCMTSSEEKVRFHMKFASLEKHTNCTVLPAVLLSGSLVFLYFLSDFANFVFALQEKNYIFAVVIAGIFLLEHLLKRRKKTASPSAESGPKDQRINLLFYDTFLHCTFPSYPGTSYYYKDFYQIKEGPSIFCLYLTRTKLVIVEKKNCSPELIDHIRQLQKLRK